MLIELFVEVTFAQYILTGSYSSKQQHIVNIILTTGLDSDSTSLKK